ncbi:MAG: 3-deoxy-manno-octulosonate cytidylyltransferase [Legionella sp.]|nr:3-deoxy-manno-octulosonate cytidylyltransferase [Legionella sp.]
MSQGFHIIIPARFQSTRFPGKLLMKLDGISILERVYRQACLSEAKSIIIATDNEVIAQHAHQFGALVKMTANTHQSGSDRLAQVVTEGDYAAEDIIVNVQGDEPFISPQSIAQVAALLENTKAPVSTLCWPIKTIEELHNHNIVKVVRSCDNYALYFSRSPIPAHRDEINSFSHSFKHIGLYAYRAAFLLELVQWPACELELAEALEQLRILWHGAAIKVEIACVKPLQDINTKEDLILAQKFCKHVTSGWPR